jgi:queuosine precursor transporter
MQLDRRTQLFVVLTGVFVTSLVVGDIIGPKLVEVDLGSFVSVISVGMLPFPITFLLTDILNEFYGKRSTRFVTWVGFGMALFAFAIIQAALPLPWAPFTQAPGYQGTVQGAFDNVFGGSQRILFASMCAYLIGQYVDIAVFNGLKRLTQNRLLWLRATGSTLISQLIDTVVVGTVAWAGLQSPATILNITLTSYAVKLLVAVGLTPLVYAGHALLERRLGMRPVVLGPDGEPMDEDETRGGSTARAVTG